MRLGKYTHMAFAIMAAFTLTATSGTSMAQDKKIRLQMASSYGASLPLLGESGVAYVKKVKEASNGSIDIKFNEPNALVPVLQTFDAVAKGSVDVGWTASAFWSGKDTAYNFFSSVPFGPDAPEYLAWLKHGGGKELMAEMYEPHNIHAITCAFVSAEGSGWFRKKIESLDDLKGMKMRFLGLGAKVMEKLGVATQLVAPGEIYQALQLGVLDAAEFSTPVMDEKFGFYQVAKYYYMPGWHQQATAIDLLINKAKWDSMSKTQQAIIEQACGNSIMETIALGEAKQFEAMKSLQEKGVEIVRWAPDFLDAFKEKWDEVATEEAKNNPNFKKVYDSYTKFRKNYALWGNYQRLN